MEEKANAVLVCIILDKKPVRSIIFLRLKSFLGFD